MERLKKQKNIILPSLKVKADILSGKNGYTLIELLVSMGIFTVVMTLFTSFFITLYRLQTDYRATASLNQEARIISEVFNRYAREANTVTLSEGRASSGGACTGTCDYYKAADLQLPRGVDSSETINVYFNGAGTNFLLTQNTTGQNSLTSSNVMLTSFKIKRPVENVYPKVLTYEFELAKNTGTIAAQVASTKTGDRIFFKGYVNMRNEL